MKRFLGLLALCLMTAGMASAQTGSVTGMVYDDQGAPVENARVSLHFDGGCAGYVFTGPDGVYFFEEVAVGIYTVKAGKPQVGSASVDDIEVLEGETTQVPDLVLTCTGPGGGGQHGPGYKYQYHNQYRGGE